jgi:hypothetical protein
MRSAGQDIRAHDVESKTSDLTIPQNGVGKVWGKGTQFRRTNDSMYENFRVPTINPEIEVIINEEEFTHAIAFGTHGDWTKSKYKDHYTLSGVYFPGQFMWVRWWPKIQSGRVLQALTDCNGNAGQLEARQQLEGRRG